MSEWRNVTLADVCSLRAGNAFKTAEQGALQGDLPFIKVSDMNLPHNWSRIQASNNWVTTDQAQRLKLKPFGSGTAVFAKIGEALKQNRVRLLTRETVIDNNMMGALPDPDAVDSTFFYYLLNTVDFAATATGTALPYLTVSTLKRVSVRVPDLTTQLRIGGVLEAFDNLIENNRRRVAVLEEMARAIYREWFVKFRYPGHEDVPMVDSALGPIPEGWEVQPFDEVAAFVNGYAFKPSHWGESGRPIIKIKELKQGVTPSTPRHPAENIAPKYWVERGDLLFSWSADLGVYLWSDEPGLLNQHLFTVRPKLSGITTGFLHHALGQAMPQFRARAQGTTMRHIKRSALTEVALAVPNVDVADRFTRDVEPIHEEAARLSQESVTIEAIRDVLLPKLVTGQIDVSSLDLDAMIAEHVA